MLLQLTTTHRPASDLSFLLHKHPDRLQAFPLSNGKAHIFYPEVSEERCTAALMLDIDPIEMVRGSKKNIGDFALGHYVNDRPYVASSFLSVALSKCFNTAMNGKCTDKPELAELQMPFEVEISALPARRGGEGLIRRLFEPLGYEVEVKRHVLDETIEAWGDSHYFNLRLQHTVRLSELLTHLYVMIPVLDNDKHYWVGQNEVEKLLERGKGWLETHPEKEQITKRYLRYFGGLTRQALDRLTEDEPEEDEEAEPEEVKERRESLHTQRLNRAAEVLKASGAKRVVDLGCGEGKLLRLLLKEGQFDYLLGMDVSHRALGVAAERLYLHDMAPKKRERIDLIQGSLVYRDKRIHGFDAAAVVEVIEHLDEDRLDAFEKVVFEYAQPKTVVLTTPNAEYNQLYEGMETGSMRHNDHRFEWTRSEFRAWADRVAGAHNYQVTIEPIGEVDPNWGASSQMAVFTHEHQDT